MAANRAILYQAAARGDGFMWPPEWAGLDLHCFVVVAVLVSMVQEPTLRSPALPMKRLLGGWAR